MRHRVEHLSGQREAAAFAVRVEEHAADEVVVLDVPADLRGVAVDLHGKADVPQVHAGGEDAGDAVGSGDGGSRRAQFFYHSLEDEQRFPPPAVLGVAGDDGRPSDAVPAGHAVEERPRAVAAPGAEEARDGGVPGDRRRRRDFVEYLARGAGRGAGAAAVHLNEGR